MTNILYNFVTFFVVIDPVGVAAIFAVMTANAEPAQRNAMARKATFLAGILLLCFAVLGEVLLRALGVSLPAFRIAGGLLLLLHAVDMVLARPRKMTTVEDQETEHRHDITVFPLAFPLIAGPGAMTTVVLLMGQAVHQPVAMLSLFGVVALVLGIMLVMLLGSGRVYALLGVTGSNVIGRVLGILLTALAVQFVIDGLLEVLNVAGH